MKNKIFSILAVIVSLWGGINVYAYDFYVDGIYYNVISSANLTVAVTKEGSSRLKYTGSVVIPESVTYKGKTYSVTSIGHGAFNGCSALTEIIIPNSVTSIGNKAFYRCSALTEIIIPNSVESIGSEAFADSDEIERIIIGNSITSIGTGAFDDMTRLNETFLLSLNPPQYSDRIGGEVYVLDKDRYLEDDAWSKAGSIIVEMVDITTDAYVYNGSIPSINYTNNLKAYDCTATFSDITEYNAGTHQAYLHVVYSNGVDIEFDVPFTYTISPAVLTMNVNNSSKIYGDDNPEFTCSAVTGFVNSETLESLGGEIVLYSTANARSGVGEYPIVGSVNGLSNYEVNSIDGILTIEKAPIIVKVNDCSRKYGDENPGYTVKYDGLKLDENTITLSTPFQFNTEATINSPVGDYVVEVSGGLSKNYDFVTYESGILHIDKRELSVVVVDQSRKYNEDNPKFIFTCSNFAQGETDAVLEELPQISCSATSKSPAGEYPIVVSGGRAQNYSFKYTNGKLTVNKINLMFESDDVVITEFTNEPQAPLIIADGDVSIENYEEFLNGYKEYGSNEDGTGWIKVPLNNIVNAGEYKFELSVNNDSLYADAEILMRIEKARPIFEWNQHIAPMKVGDTLYLDYKASVGNVRLLIEDENVIRSTWDEEGNDYIIAKGVGTTDLTLFIEGNSNIYETERITKTVKVESSGVNGVEKDDITVYSYNHYIYVDGLTYDTIIRVYDIDGMLIYKGYDSMIPIAYNGIYIVKIESRAFKIAI